MDTYPHIYLLAPEQEMDLGRSSRSPTSLTFSLALNSECQASGGTLPDFHRLNKGLLSGTYQSNTGHLWALLCDKVRHSRGLDAAEPRLPQLSEPSMVDRHLQSALFQSYVREDECKKGHHSDHRTFLWLTEFWMTFILFYLCICILSGVIFLKKNNKTERRLPTPSSVPWTPRGCLRRLSPLSCLAPQDKFDPFVPHFHFLHHAFCCLSLLPASTWHLHFLRSDSATTTCVCILFPLQE